MDVEIEHSPKKLKKEKEREKRDKLNEKFGQVEINTTFKWKTKGSSISLLIKLNITS